MYKFEENSRVCFLGDSIIANGHMIRRVYEYYRECGINLEIYNCGMPGDTAQNGLSRLYDTVFCYNPTDVVISFGMNDINYFLYDGRDADDSVIMERRRSIDSSIMNMRAIAKECEKKGIRVTFFTTNPYDELSDGNECFYGTAAALYEIGARLKLMSKEFGGHYIDGHGEFYKVIKDLLKENKTIVGEDRIHPTKPGQELLAQIFLNGQGFSNEIMHNYDALEKASEREFDEWEKKRFELEIAAKETEFAEWIVCRGIKNPEIIKSIVEEKVNTEEKEFIVKLIAAYLTKKDVEAEMKEALITHTKKGCAK